MALLHAPSLAGGFVWDDFFLIEENGLIRDWKNAASFFASGIFDDSEYYRPVLMLSLMVDYHLWGLDVLGYHLTTTCVHLLAAICVYWLTYLLMRRRRIALRLR